MITTPSTTATVTRGPADKQCVPDRFYRVRSGGNVHLVFTTAQDAADWIEANMPGVRVQWEVKP